MSFHHPSSWFLLLLLLLPLLCWRWAGRRRATIAVSSTAAFAQMGVSWAVRLRWIVPALRSVALILLILCIARPQKANEHTRIFTEGIAIQLVVDRSGSMRAEDFELDRKRASRMDAVKRIVAEFVTGGEDLPGRPDDLIGLITFASFADSLCPLTLDHDHLASTISQTRAATQAEGAATAIGDAVALGVERMHNLAQRTDLFRTQRIKSNVMILLTDGEHNAGDIDPITAAEMAAAYDITIYTIGAGTDRGFALMPTVNPFTGREELRNQPVSIDEATLKEIASITGGRYFRATDTDTLRNIYAQIDELERTEIEQRRYTDYKELTLESFRLGPLTAPPLLTVVFVLLALEITLRNTRFRTIP